MVRDVHLEAYGMVHADSDYTKTWLLFARFAVVQRRRFATW
jgi:hypothetical protein